MCVLSELQRSVIEIYRSVGYSPILQCSIRYLLDDYLPLEDGGSVYEACRGCEMCDFTPGEMCMKSEYNYLK